MTSNRAERVLFVTGKLAEPSLRGMLDKLAPAVGFEPEVAVLPITVAALLTTPWVATHLNLSTRVDRMILPGFCRGDLDILRDRFGVAVERGPKDLRDLPEHFGHRKGPPPNYGKFDIEIIAEINHAPCLGHDEILRMATDYRRDGADRIDLGCDPGSTWNGVRDVTQMLRSEGFRVSIDTFNPVEVTQALTGGADLVLSVNGTNLDEVRHWHADFPEVEVVAIPDVPSDHDSLVKTVERLDEWNVPYRIDPIVEPIGFGFAASLGRYLTCRAQFPDAEMMMGIGNLTELTDVDSAGVNVLLAGFCQEVGIRSVLTTQVIPWCQTAVREFDLARRLVYHAIREGVQPKHLEPGLVMLRDPKRHELGQEGLQELARRVTDRNYRLFAEQGEIHVINGSMYLHGNDPFALFEQMCERDSKLDPSHAFYLGYEMAKAVTALTLGKQYTQDQALRWGVLTVPERSTDP